MQLVVKKLIGIITLDDTLDDFEADPLDEIRADDFGFMITERMMQSTCPAQHEGLIIAEGKFMPLINFLPRTCQEMTKRCASLNDQCRSFRTRTSCGTDSHDRSLVFGGSQYPDKKHICRFSTNSPRKEDIINRILLSLSVSARRTLRFKPSLLIVSPLCASTQKACQVKFR
uniref:Uncharacterized protein n=1 Tax=Ditylenchus dipsaci TaxID=166011 RepID=A0A915CR02_9BILA